MSTRNGRVLTGQRFKIKYIGGYNMDSSIISIIIVLITMGLFVWNRLPISVVAILGSVAMAMLFQKWIYPQYTADSAQQAGRW